MLPGSERKTTRKATYGADERGALNRYRYYSGKIKRLGLKDGIDNLPALSYLFSEVDESRLV